MTNRISNRRAAALIGVLGLATFVASPEVSDGVKNGDQVILNPPADLVEGQTVNSHVVSAPDT